MKKATLLIALIFTTMTIAGTAMAWGPCGQKGGGSNKGCVQSCRGYDNPGFANLTQEQKDQIKDLRQQYFDETADLRIELVAKHKEMQILWKTSSPDGHISNPLWAA